VWVLWVCGCVCVVGRCVCTHRGASYSTAFMPVAHTRISSPHTFLHPITSPLTCDAVGWHTADVDPQGEAQLRQ